MPNLLAFAGYCLISVVAITLILRGCYFLFVLKADPLKAIVTNPKNWFEQKVDEAEELKKLAELS